MALLTRLQRAVTAGPPGPVAAALILAGCVVVPTLLRMALDPWLGLTLWYPTYYPAALIGTLLLGWRCGVALMVLSALAANWFFIPPRHTLAPELRDVAGIIVFLVADGVIVLAASLLRTALRRLQAAHERETLLNAELQHRMKNTLAVIQGLVAQTARRGDDPKVFMQALEGRLGALGSAHDLLSSGRWEMCELPELAKRALAPFQDGGRIAIDGSACALAPECCVPLVLALHELATNAVKYGALSVPAGTASVTWQPEGALIVLTWAERDGPAVVAPQRRGMGTRLLKRQAGLEAVDLRFAPEGVACDIGVRPAP